MIFRFNGSFRYFKFLSTVTSIRTIVVHYGTFVHPKNNLGCVTSIRTIVLYYGASTQLQLSVW